jgi:hypothetical protein
VRAAILPGFIVLAFGLSHPFNDVEMGAAPKSGDDTKPKPYGLEKPRFAQISSASCAASACHGRGHVGNVGSEHTTWAPEIAPDGPVDPHAKAYRVLFNARSVLIAKAMNIPEAHNELLCLKCHTVEGVHPKRAIAEGVGCGACHGPAEKWLSEHTQPGWKARSNREKQELGFVPLNNLVSRSLICAGCHVGDTDREVNHDLIAAGHPRLAFEYTSFHYSSDYRQHWRERRPQRDFEVRAWLCGQAATLRAATDLLRQRAERASANLPKEVWPEFSGYSCYSCHQKIGEENLRRDTGTAKRTVGVPGWELWSNTAAKVASDLSHIAYPGIHATDLRELAVVRKLMEQQNPNPEAIAAQSKKAICELDAWLAELQAADDNCYDLHLQGNAPRQFAHKLAENALSQDRTKLADHDWDALKVSYLGCAAMYHADRESEDVRKWSLPLTRLNSMLNFPQGFNSPAGFGVKDRDVVREQFLELYRLTKLPGASP